MSGEERRQHPRYDGRQAAVSSVFLTAPDLADGPIEPVDFSSGGFGVRLPRCPLLGSVAACTLHIRGVTLGGIAVRVAWTREEPGPPRAWAVGLAIHMEEGERDDVVTVLTGLLAEIAPGS